MFKQKQWPFVALREEGQYNFKMTHIYILRSLVDYSFYVGSTDDVYKRLNEHNSKSSKYTSTKAPFELIWFCAFKEKTKALQFERYLKSGSGFAFRNKRLI